MQRRGRVISFLLLNIAISALTTILVINLWLRNNLAPQAVSTPDNGAASAVETSAPAPEITQPENNSSASGQVSIATIIGPGDYTNERLQVRYSGADELSLAGWQLFDEDENVFVFPSLTMYSGGAVTVYTSTGINTVVELHWGQPEAVWTSGEVATLVDTQGTVQATYTIP
jgi:hypothetical protein